MNPIDLASRTDFPLFQYLFPYRLLHQRRRPALIEKQTQIQTLPFSGERRRLKAAHTKACAEAQAGGKRLDQSGRSPLAHCVHGSPTPIRIGQGAQAPRAPAHSAIVRSRMGVPK